ncbi:MAG TPA: hypothetical protein VGK19_02225 [Capsulimonadaceae bacterium]|jgi:CHASE2 domain-containing sensor protein
MPPAGSLLTVILVSLTTWSLVTAVTMWLSKEDNVPFKVFAIILWTAVIIMSMAFLFGKNAGAIAMVAAVYRFIVFYAVYNREKGDKEDKDSKDDIDSTR